MGYEEFHLNNGQAVSVYYPIQKTDASGSKYWVLYRKNDNFLNGIQKAFTWVKKGVKQPHWIFRTMNKVKIYNIHENAPLASHFDNAKFIPIMFSHGVCSSRT